MKIGWCAPLDDAALLRDLGYDFVEAPLAPMNFSSLRSSDYSGMISVECGSPIAEDGKRNTLAFPRPATAPLTCPAGDRI